MIFVVRLWRVLLYTYISHFIRFIHRFNAKILKFCISFNKKQILWQIVYVCASTDLVQITATLYTIIVYIGISIQFLELIWRRDDIKRFVIHLENYINMSKLSLCKYAAHFVLKDTFLRRSYTQKRIETISNNWTKIEKIFQFLWNIFVRHMCVVLLNSGCSTIACLFQWYC